MSRHYNVGPACKTLVRVLLLAFAVHMFGSCLAAASGNRGAWPSLSGSR